MRGLPIAVDEGEVKGRDEEGCEDGDFELGKLGWMV